MHDEAPGIEQALPVGYQVAQAVKKTARGCCSPAEGTIYPVLRQYEHGGYLTSRTEVVSGRERRIYSLTEKGSSAFQVALEAWLEATEALLACEDIAGSRANRHRARDGAQ